MESSKLPKLSSDRSGHYFSYTAKEGIINKKNVEKTVNVEDSVKAVGKFTGCGMRFWRLLPSSSGDKTEKIVNRVFDEFKKGNIKQGIGDLRYVSDEEMGAFIKKCKKDKSGIGGEILQIFNDVKIGKAEGANKFEEVSKKFNIALKQRECKAAKKKVIENIGKFEDLCDERRGVAGGFFAILRGYVNFKSTEILEPTKYVGLLKIKGGEELLKAANECHSAIGKYKKIRYELKKLESPPDSNRVSLYSAEIEDEDFRDYFYDYEDIEIEPREGRGSVYESEELKKLSDSAIEDLVEAFFEDDESEHLKEKESVYGSGELEEPSVNRDGVGGFLKDGSIEMKPPKKKDY